MNTALIISSTEKSVSFLTKMLEQAEINDITTVPTALEARGRLGGRDYDLCVINAPLTDEYGESLARSISDTSLSEVILIVKEEHLNEISNKLSDCGAAVIPKPLNRVFFWNALKLTLATHKKMLKVQDENKKLLKKIEDIRTIDRAKCILISYLAITEAEAHRHIEKQAMDLRLTKRAVAEEILKTYEN
jgi:response regulator NasT